MYEDMRATEDLTDVAIVGGGPAGLSAALVLARCRKRVIVLDDNRPRNAVARSVYGYLGFDGITPQELREAGRREVARYGVRFVSERVVAGRCALQDVEGRTTFELETDGGRVYAARKVLVATGTRDDLTAISNLARFFGKSVHHCPYCAGWEVRDRRLVALAAPDKIVGLVKLLRTWSGRLVACTNGKTVAPEDRERLDALDAKLWEQSIRSLEGRGEQLERIDFDDGYSIVCDALFFAPPQHQTSDLAEQLGCRTNAKRMLVRNGKQGSGIRGVFLAGDADGDVQFAVVAAAEGAIAATAIHRELVEEDTSRKEFGCRRVRR
jgi:thioredoxin reductase